MHDRLVGVLRHARDDELVSGRPTNLQTNWLGGTELDGVADRSRPAP